MTPALDLFAGPGGWDVAAAMLGLDVLGVELDPTACDTAVAAGHRRLVGDVAVLDPLTVVDEHLDGEVSVLIASPPCQAFSTAGKGHGRLGKPALLAAVERIAAGDDPRRVAVEVDALLGDARAALVLEPLRWALDLEPDTILLEQVPPVLPLWEAFADVLRADGYTVATGNLTSEQYDTPQTRRRAILVASRRHAVTLPEPVRRKYRKGEAQHEGDQSLRPWLSMADALGWHRELVGFARLADRGPEHAVTIDGVDYRSRDLRDADEPALTLTEKARSWERRSYSLTTAARTRPNDRTQPRDLGEPAQTIAFGHATMQWRERFADQTGAAVEDEQWPEHRPATTVAGRNIVGHPGATANRYNGSPKSRNDGVKVSVGEAACLQGFPADYPWQGSRTAQYRQVGDAVPPPLAWHVARAALGLPVEVWPLYVEHGQVAA